MKDIDTNTAALPQEDAPHPSLSGRLQSWVYRQRMARKIEHLESLPAYLQKDLGFPDLHDLPRDTRRAVIMAALRRF